MPRGRRVATALCAGRHGHHSPRSPVEDSSVIGSRPTDYRLDCGPDCSPSAPDEIAEGVEAICAELQKGCPGTRVLLLGLLPRSAKPDGRREKVAQVNTRIARLDGKHGVIFLDIGPKFLSEDIVGAVIERMAAQEGDLLLMMAGASNEVNPWMGRLRPELAEAYGLIDPSEHAFTWILDFPLFERDKEGRITSMHHPFTAPQEEDLPLLDGNPEACHSPERMKDLAVDSDLDADPLFPYFRKSSSKFHEDRKESLVSAFIPIPEIFEDAGYINDFDQSATFNLKNPLTLFFQGFLLRDSLLTPTFL